MSTRILRIENCKDCPYLYKWQYGIGTDARGREIPYYTCEECHKQIAGNLTVIPNFCPLEELPVLKDEKRILPVSGIKLCRRSASASNHSKKQPK